MKFRMLLFVTAVSVVTPAIAAAQGSGGGVGLQGAAGTHLRDAGHDLSAAISFVPNRRIEFLLGVERSHLPTTSGTTSVTRGGTADLITGEVRVAPFGTRVSPYLVAGAGLGKSRPNVNEQFPDEVTNDIFAVFGGVGVRLSVNDHFSLFADVRAMGFGERDTVSLRLPVRAGLAVRF